MTLSPRHPYLTNTQHLKPGPMLSMVSQRCVCSFSSLLHVNFCLLYSECVLILSLYNSTWLLPLQGLCLLSLAMCFAYTLFFKIYLFIFIFVPFFLCCSFIHMCIHCLGHFSTLPSSPTFPPPFLSSVSGRFHSALVTDFVEEKT
jgi:hypothetical protein